MCFTYLQTSECVSGNCNHCVCMNRMWFAVLQVLWRFLTLAFWGCHGQHSASPRRQSCCTIPGTWRIGQQREGTDQSQTRGFTCRKELQISNKHFRKLLYSFSYLLSFRFFTQCLDFWALVCVISCYWIVHYIYCTHTLYINTHTAEQKEIFLWYYTSLTARKLWLMTHDAYQLSGEIRL